MRSRELLVTCLPLAVEGLGTQPVLPGSHHPLVVFLQTETTAVYVTNSPSGGCFSGSSVRPGPGWRVTFSSWMPW